MQAEIIWTDVLLLDNVLQEAGLPDLALEVSVVDFEQLSSSLLLFCLDDR